MSKHRGQTVEKVIRRDGHSISEVARMMNVNRRSVYNWFNQPALRQEIIYKMGHGIMHDFFVEFPELFTSADFVFKNTLPRSPQQDNRQDPYGDLGSQWKEKYMELYPRYKKLLDRAARKEHTLSNYN
jgi:hypothetical protein